MKKFLIGFLAFLGVLGLVAGAYVTYFILKVDYKYTGQELFDEVNSYRKSVNVSELVTDPVICDNLVERYLSIKEPNSGHRGFEEWLAAEGIANNPSYGLIGEIYVKDVSTPNNAIRWWLGSPGHKSTLERPEFNSGCSYANDGTGVVILAEKKVD